MINVRPLQTLGDPTPNQCGLLIDLSDNEVMVYLAILRGKVRDEDRETAATIRIEMIRGLQHCLGRPAAGRVN